MTTRAIVAHQIPGRIRLQIQSQRGNVVFFDQLSQRFSGVEGVRLARANPTAGSFVLEYEGPLEDVIARSGAQNILELAPAPISASTRQVVQGLDKPVNLVTGREIDPMFMAGTAFSLMTLLQGLRGKVLVPAATAFWYATTIFQQSRMVQLGEAVEASGNKT